MIRALLVADPGSNLPSVLESDGDITVVGQVTAAADAVDLATTARPDVVVMALGTHAGSGHEAIERIMDRAPTPIIVLSAPGEEQSPAVVAALVAGALVALPAPAWWTAGLGAELRTEIRRLSRAWVIRHLRDARAPTPGRPDPPRQPTVVAMAASTGGPSAIATVLADLGGLDAPVLIVQHLHPDFTAGLLAWMVRVSALPVEIAHHGQTAEPGRVYLAPGDVHLRLGPHRRLVLDPEPPSAHRPSADVLFTSVAELAGPAGIGVVLTGMGDDGARGLLQLRRQGGQTLAQDEGSSAVFGMPRAAHRMGAVGQVRPLSQLAGAVRHAVRALEENRT